MNLKEKLITLRNAKIEINTHQEKINEIDDKIQKLFRENNLVVYTHKRGKHIEYTTEIMDKILEAENPEQLLKAYKELKVKKHELISEIDDVVEKNEIHKIEDEIKEIAPKNQYIKINVMLVDYIEDPNKELEELFDACNIEYNKHKGFRENDISYLVDLKKLEQNPEKQIVKLIKKNKKQYKHLFNVLDRDLLKIMFYNNDFLNSIKINNNYIQLNKITEYSNEEFENILKDLEKNDRLDKNKTFKLS